MLKPLARRLAIPIPIDFPCPRVLKNSVTSQRYASLISGCAVFCIAALLLTSLGQNMFQDADSFWHLAAGNWILSHRAIPLTDPWSFTAGDYRWLDISWMWDSIYSYMHAHYGWHGAVVFNALIMALALTLVYAGCLLRSGDGMASFLTALGAMTMVIPLPLLRPLHVTPMMIAGWMLLLGMAARRECRALWLILLPVSMLLWVNMHGGFILGPVLLAAFFAQALWQRDEALARALAFTGVATLLAIFCNPYGIDIIEAVRRSLAKVAQTFILEWQPFIAAPPRAAFFPAACRSCHAGTRASAPHPAGGALAGLWLAAVGHKFGAPPASFAVISAPAFACALRGYLTPKHSGRRRWRWPYSRRQGGLPTGQHYR